MAAPPLAILVQAEVSLVQLAGAVAYARAAADQRIQRKDPACAAQQRLWGSEAVLISWRQSQRTPGNRSTAGSPTLAVVVGSEREYDVLHQNCSAWLHMGEAGSGEPGGSVAVCAAAVPPQPPSLPSPIALIVQKIVLKTP